MAEPMVIDVDGEVKATPNASDQRKPLKRKRRGGSPADSLLNLTSEEKSAKIDGLREELKSLFTLHKKLMGCKVNENAEEIWNSSNKSKITMDSAIAVLMEESELPLSKLVGEIFEKLKDKIGNGNGGSVSSVASVKSKVLLIGQRTYNGLLNEDSDLLEDDAESALWCWETKDLKILPKSMRDMLKIRRTCRKKIHERIKVVSAILTALEKSESNQNCHQELVKASARLSKTLSEADICVIVDNVVQETDAEVVEKGAKEEKLLVKQLEKNKREEEKERRKMERELQKEKLQNEKELKRLQDEAEKEEKRREKEEADMKKLFKRHQEEAEKDQRRKEKEEADLKRRLSLQKQASLMERFLKRGRGNSATQNFQSPGNGESDSSPKRSKEMPLSVTVAMDSILLTNNGIQAEDIWKLHLNSWRSLGHSIRSNRNMHWGIRQMPKTKLVKELKLTANRGLAPDDEMSIEKFVDGWVDFSADSRLCQTRTDSAVPTSRKHVGSKQLLQFDKSNRPAFYGIWPRKSQVVSACHPFAKDPELDYDIDSDEEWEEEEPGESLSDCDKDDEDESLAEGCSKGDDEDGSEDGFFVPDGYLSENEGVEVDKVNSDYLVEETRSPTSREALQSEDSHLLLRQQKCLQKLTEQALRKNQPMIILNFMHEKAPLLFADNIIGTEKLEKMCLQALSICPFPSGPSLEISIRNDEEEEDEEVCTPNSTANTTTLTSTAAILESDLPQIVSVIQSCTSGINKVVESLQEKFPSISKSQLRNKVREVSEFVDNQWQVKKDVLVKLGLTISPGKGSGRVKSIATFFSKRCLPPSGKSINPAETSTQSSKKPVSSTAPQQGSAI